MSPPDTFQITTTFSRKMCYLETSVSPLRPSDLCLEPGSAGCAGSQLHVGWDWGSVSAGIRAQVYKNEDSNIRLRSKCYQLRSRIQYGLGTED